MTELEEIHATIAELTRERDDAREALADMTRRRGDAMDALEALPEGARDWTVGYDAGRAQERKAWRGCWPLAVPSPDILRIAAEGLSELADVVRSLGDADRADRTDFFAETLGSASEGQPVDWDDILRHLADAPAGKVRGRKIHATIAEASAELSETIRSTLKVLVSTRGGPPWIQKALAYRDVGGEVLETAVGSQTEPGATIASSPERRAVVDAHKATLDRLTTPPEDLVDLIVYRLTIERR